jgi:hypothetical protein
MINRCDNEEPNMSYVRRAIVALTGTFGLTLIAVSAPATKEKDGPPGPVKEEQLADSRARLEKIALALISHADSHEGALPTNVVDKKGKLLLSWRVQILPELDEEKLYKQFKLDEPWDSEHNKKLIDQMPAVFAPVRVRADKGLTFYQALSGAKGWLQPGKGVPFPASFPDGTSNTFLVAEAAKPVVWTRPDDLEYDGTTVPKFGGLFDGRFHAAHADGSVNRYRADAPAATLGLLIDPADGNVIDLDGALDQDKK